MKAHLKNVFGLASTRFLITLTLVFFGYCAVYAQDNGIDFNTATFEEIHLYVTGIITYIWGVISKFIPKLKDAAIPKPIVVGLGGVAAVLILGFIQGWGVVLSSLWAIPTTLGLYDILKASFGGSE